MEAGEQDLASILRYIRAKGRGSYGYIRDWRDYTFGVPTERGLEMVKTAFCLVLATWMTGCLMAIVYSREIAEFVFERVQ